MSSILVIDDDSDAQALVAKALRGYDLHFADSSAQARDVFTSSPAFGLVLLDLGLPDGNGHALYTELFAGNATRAPVIFLTASDDARDVVAAFSLGAEDFVRKPYDPLELRARVDARLGSHDGPGGEAVRQIGCDLRIDAEKMRVYFESNAGETELMLTATEYRLLAALSEKPGRLMTRDNVIAEVWNGSVIGPRTVDTHVCNLRLKLGQSSVEIEAVRGLGYRLVDSSGPHAD